MQVSGHRIGTAEVESALVSHPQCAEAAVVPVDHDIKGQAIYAYVTLMEVSGSPLYVLFCSCYGCDRRYTFEVTSCMLARNKRK